MQISTQPKITTCRKSQRISPVVIGQKAYPATETATLYTFLVSVTGGTISWGGGMTPPPARQPHISPRTWSSISLSPCRYFSNIGQFGLKVFSLVKLILGRYSRLLVLNWNTTTKPKGRSSWKLPGAIISADISNCVNINGSSSSIIPYPLSSLEHDNRAS